MKFKIDENLPLEAALEFASAGHDARTVLEEHLGGSADEAVFATALSEERAVVTLDLDFGDIRAYPPEGTAGIIVLRLLRQDVPSVVAAIQRGILLLDREPLAGHLWIVEEERIRVRGIQDASDA